MLQGDFALRGNGEGACRIIIKARIPGEIGDKMLHVVSAMGDNTEYMLEMNRET
ncbi:MAG: hypothetical protein J6J97_06565 [Akkermansia sp.]|nr:hypothetical protein [Akkermansia sp.]